MSLPLEATGSSQSSLSWLRQELAPREGRAWAVTHISIACAITVAVAMIFKIPEPTYMAYMVFLISKDERIATVKTAVGGFAAVTLAVILTLGLSLVDLGEPALRLPIMAGLTFLAMFSVRVSALGPITFLAGFVIVLLQSVVDDLPRPEPYTRITLWIWVVVLVPVLVTLAIDLAFGQTVELLAQRLCKRTLRELAEGLSKNALTREELARHRENIVQLLDKGIPLASNASLIRVNAPALRELLDLLMLLEAVPLEPLKSNGPAWAQELLVIESLIGQSVDKVEAPRVPVSTMMWERAMDESLTRLREALVSPTSVPTHPPKAARRLIAADAFSNPDYWQFALKTTLAMMLVYSLYTLLDWPGMRTSIVTCFFVALGSLGETIHKLTLRISGAILGGAVAALCIVFVLPHLTDMGQLCLLIAAVSAAAGWIATSSERLSYAGLQMAFAFFLGILQGYAPATDLTVLRDRVAGILLGNIVMTLIFSTLWPKSAGGRIRLAVADALRALSRLLSNTEDEAASREVAARALVQANNYRILRALEGHLVASAVPSEVKTELTALAVLEGTVFAASIRQDPQTMPEPERAALSSWAAAAANAAAAGLPWPTVPSLHSRTEWTPQIERAARAVVQATDKGMS